MKDDQRNGGGGRRRPRLRDAVRGKVKRLRRQEEVGLPPHHRPHAEEEAAAAVHAADPAPHAGVLRPHTGALHLPTDVMESDQTSLFERPGPVVTFIVLVAVLFILTVAWFVAHEPVR